MLPETAANERQFELTNFRAFVEVNGIRMVDPQIVKACSSLSIALLISCSPQQARRPAYDKREGEYRFWQIAENMGMKKANFSKKVNGGNIDHDFLLRLAHATGNMLPLQYLAHELHCTLSPEGYRAA